MTEVARLSDSLQCGDVINEGSGNVFVNGLPIARLDKDKTAGHCYLPTVLKQSPGNAGTVFANGEEVAMKDDWIDLAAHFCGAPPNIHPGPPTAWPIITGSPSVFIYA